MRHTRLMRNVSLGIKTLLLHKLRSMLTMLGVVFGVMSVVAMLAIVEGAGEQAQEQLRKLGVRNIIIESDKPTDEGSGGSARVFMVVYGLHYADEARIREGFETAARIAPAKIVRKEARLGGQDLELRVLGTTPEWFDLIQRPVVAGRTLHPMDIERQGNVVVLTEYGARRLLATENTIGQTLRIGGNMFEVIGIVRSEGGVAGDVQTPDQNVDAYIPVGVAQRRYGDVMIRRSSGSREMEMVQLHQLIVEADDEKNVESLAAGIKAMLARFHPNGDYKVHVPLALLRQAEQTSRTFSIVFGLIAGISLLVGGIGIMNIMLASVTERTREIGIRRAIGAKRRQIVGQFLIETVVLSMTGGLVGVALGLVVPYAVTEFTDMPTVITLWSVLLSLFIAAGVGIGFGLYPAVRAAKLDPIVALRHE